MISVYIFWMNEIPQDALSLLKSVEELIGLSIAVHDYSAGIGPALGAPVPIHENAFCRSAKQTAQAACVACDVGSVYDKFGDADLQWTLKRCHAGVWELVLPLRRHGNLCGILFAGPFRLPDTTPETWPVLRVAQSVRSPDDASRVKRLPKLAKHRIPAILRLLKELGTHIAELADNSLQPPADDVSPRLLEAYSFLCRHAHEPLLLQDLADYMDLSVPRTSQLIREQLHATFPQALNRIRIHHAQTLLRETALSVRAIAKACGYRDAAYLHRIFSREVGMTPIAYRKAQQKKSWSV